MEKSKKIISLILTICALSALCAVGASADDISTSTSTSISSDVTRSEISRSDPVRSVPDGDLSGGSSLNHLSRVEQYERFGWSVDPDYFYYDAGSLYAKNGSRSYSKSNDGPCIVAYCNPTISTNASYWTVCTCCPASYQGAPTSVQFSNSSVSSSVSYNIDGNLYFAIRGGGLTSTPSVTNIPTDLHCYPSITTIIEELLSISGFSSSEPEPEPEPPANDDIAPFEYTAVSGYYFNRIVDNTTFPQHTFSTMPYPEFKDINLVINSNASSNSLFFGAQTNYSDILTDYTIISMEASVLVLSENPAVTASYSSNVSFDSTVLLSNSTDYADTNFSSVDVKTFLPSENWKFYQWVYPGTAYTYLKVACAFTLEGYSGTLPTGALSVLFSSSTLHTSSIFWVPFSFKVTYYTRDSASDNPESIPNLSGFPQDNNSNPWLDAMKDSGIDPFGEYNNELNWATELGDSTWNNYSGQLDEIIDTIFPNDPFSGFYNSMVSLYNGVAYSGTGGTLYLPEAYIPWDNSSLKLWDRQEIPLSYYISQIPTQYCVIISFLLLAGGGFAMFAMWGSFFRRIWFGDVRSERF